MSKSFALVNGDLALSGTSYSLVSGSAKLAQDLRLWTLEKLGIDPANPLYGNTLDGGTLNGIAIPSMIGQINSKIQASQVQSIIQQMLIQYQQMQLAKIKSETIQYNGQTTLTDDEILETVNSVTATMSQNIIIVQASITTLAGTNLTLTIPLPT